MYILMHVFINSGWKLEKKKINKMKQKQNPNDKITWPKDIFKNDNINQFPPQYLNSIYL